MVVQLLKKIRIRLIIKDALKGIIGYWSFTVLVGCAIQNGWLGDSDVIVKFTRNEFNNFFAVCCILLVVIITFSGFFGKYNKEITS